MSAYVIVGASLAGATAAITLREEGADGTVTLIGAEQQPPYERPPLSKAYLRGDTPFDKALVRPIAFYADHDIQTIFGTRAIRIDPADRIVELEDHRRVPFDALLIATGGQSRQMSIPGSDLEGIYGLRTVEDADLIRKEIVPGRRVVVVGMGFIGSEVAASLRQKGLDVVAIGPSKRRSSACSAKRSARPLPTSIAVTVFKPSSKIPWSVSREHDGYHPLLPGAGCVWNVTSWS